MVRARKSRQAAKKKTAEVEAAFQLDEISGSDVSIHSSEEDSYVSDDYEDDDDIDVDEVNFYENTALNLAGKIDYLRLINYYVV